MEAVAIALRALRRDERGETRRVVAAMIRTRHDAARALHDAIASHARSLVASRRCCISSQIVGQFAEAVRLQETKRACARRVNDIDKFVVAATKRFESSMRGPRAWCCALEK